jgi:EAL domain-containing protein (putative c-di-GMP-specific phosphodiesterase class I)/GGDEF domain-containing protein
MFGVRHGFGGRSVHVAATDELTGLLSAEAFTAAVDRQVALALRYDRPGAVVVLAVRRTDEPGSRAVARALRERLRSTDLPARLSGSEFGVLLAEADMPAAREVARELVALARRATGAPGAAGVACFPDDRHRPAGALLADADGALAVAVGRLPPVAVFDGGVLRSVRSADSGADRLRRALAGDGLVLDRRPVFELGTGAADHHVLSARLREGAAHGLLEKAERFGLGREIDRYVVREALADAREDRGLVVPLSAHAAADGAFADWLVGMVSASPGPAARLVLAVPEDAALAHLAEVRSLAARVGEFGSRLALDGFGRVGAYTLLKSLPVHQVRLDPGLVRGLPESDRDRVVVLALVHAAEALGAVPVATGVDGEAELTAVRGFGIGLAEGDLDGHVRRG